ncbi:DAK2 domain-containing protein [Streptomyces verrucosisporus]|uniref:DAK2 domain-containing protein n=1 Tax=Streptomyces verrucosisporus TaxID=1695161 RepID=UPI0019D08414|nr:DAK2 domain-containing protein [Streptomyces verrucosisporus]MBN3930889.1 DAK2 domain-containing protein [Streptomyces verrucosisporus]
MPHPLDAATVREWSAQALDALGRARETIDAINVYPVADADTGTNLYLTAESAARAVEAACAGEPTPAQAVRAMAHGALIGARGNSGTILAQLLRGMAEEIAEAENGGSGGPHERAGDDGEPLRRALVRAAAAARAAVAHPVEGTVLTVAAAAAGAAADTAGDCAAVARAAWSAARTALEATPGQLPALSRAGVVDAGGYGLVTVLGALVAVLSGERPEAPAAGRSGTSGPAPDPLPADAGCAASTEQTGPACEVVYLLEAGDDAVAALRTRLDALGDSLVVVGGDGLWNVHVHVDDAGAAVEAGIEAGRPFRIRITHFGVRGGDRHADRTPAHAPDRAARRAVVAVVPGDGLAELCAEAGAITVTARPGEPPASGELAQALLRTGAPEAVLLPNDPELRHTAAAAAEQARAEGMRVAIIPTRSPVQGIAALAVHEPGRRFDEDVVAMTSAAGATRYGELCVAERQAWTTAGICQAGDVLGLIDGDVALIGARAADVAAAVLDRMLSGGGELVTLVVGADAPADLADHLEEHVRRNHLAVDTLVHEGRQSGPLLIGVE